VLSVAQVKLVIQLRGAAWGLVIALGGKRGSRLQNSAVNVQTREKRIPPVSVAHVNALVNTSVEDRNEMAFWCGKEYINQNEKPSLYY
jgi:hypothetical protein